MSDRYARQRSIRALGDAAQSVLGAARVVIHGDQDDAKIAGLYLAGAGIGSIVAHERFVPELRALNGEVDVNGGARAGALEVFCGDTRVIAEGSTVMRGARAARDTIASLLGGFGS